MALSGWRNSWAMVGNAIAGDKESCCAGTAAAVVCTPAAEFMVLSHTQGRMSLSMSARAAASQGARREVVKWRAAGISNRTSDACGCAGVLRDLLAAQDVIEVMLHVQNV